MPKLVTIHIMTLYGWDQENQKKFWHSIETGIDIPKIINVIMEIPKGSMYRYEYDKKDNRILLNP